LSAGVSSTAVRVLTVVITTERATSARAIRLTTLLAVPPGQQPTRIGPTARGGSNRSPQAKAAARAGITANWAITPRTAQG
jgi:hypothetical protein